MANWFNREPTPRTQVTELDTRVASPALGDWIDALKAGDLVGRYVVRGVLGAGGMGVVLEAFDPILDRRVALKVMRFGLVAPTPEGGNEAKTVGGQMLMREANGMAQISHPHVMPIFDVGWIDGRFFLAMELNVGMTLAAWLRSNRRRWQDIVAIMMQAASGLAAIHATGLIHCDFKPGNLLVDAQGNLRIADFGLAKRSDDTQRYDYLPRNKAELSQAETMQASRSHGHAGTLSYMAPEQHRGDKLDARCDQFAFFVTLYEALFDRMPFRGTAHFDFITAIGQAPQREGFFRGRRLPKWLLEVVRQGLAEDADARFADMNEVREVLGQGLRASAQRRMLVPAGLVTALGVVAAGAHVVQSAHDPCDGLAATAASVWNEQKIQSLADRYLASASSHAPLVWESLRPRLQAQVDHWLLAAEKQCRAPEGTNLGTQRCLDAALAGIGSATQVLLTGSDESIDDPHNVLATIPEPQECFARQGQAANALPWPDDPNMQGAVATLRNKITHLRMLGRAGNLNAVRDSYPELRNEARRIGYWPVWAELEMQTGFAYSHYVELDTAGTHLRAATHLAAASGHDNVLAWTLTSRIYEQAHESSSSHELAEIQAEARALIRRVGDPPLLLAEWYNNIGISDMRMGQIQQAHAKFLIAQQMAGHLRGHSYLNIFERLNNVGIALEAMGQIAEAEQTLRRALDFVPRVGSHWQPPATAMLINLGRCAILSGRYREAEHWLIESLRTMSNLSGRLNGNVEYSCGNMQWLYEASGRSDKALYLRKKCPQTGVADSYHPLLRDVWSGFFEVHALAAAGYSRAAKMRFAMAMPNRPKREALDAGSQLFLATQIYLAAFSAQDYVQANEALLDFESMAAAPSAPAEMLNSFDLAAKKLELSLLQDERWSAASSTWGYLPATFAAKLPTFAAAYHRTSGLMGPSHPATLERTLSYLQALQAAGMVETYANVLARALDERELWSQEVPRKQLKLDLAALRYAAFSGDGPAIARHFANYLALRDLALDDPAPIASSLRYIQQRSEGLGLRSEAWVAQLDHELSQASALAAMRQTSAYSANVIDGILEQVANDPILREVISYTAR